MKKTNYVRNSIDFLFLTTYDNFNRFTLARSFVIDYQMFSDTCREKVTLFYDVAMEV